MILLMSWNFLLVTQKDQSTTWYLKQMPFLKHPAACYSMRIRKTGTCSVRSQPATKAKPGRTPVQTAMTSWKRRAPSAPSAQYAHSARPGTGARPSPASASAPSFLLRAMSRWPASPAAMPPSCTAIQIISTGSSSCRWRARSWLMKA